MYAVTRSVPFHLTMDDSTESVSCSRRTKSPAPAVTEFGSRLVSVGTGLLIVMVKSLVAVWSPDKTH